MLISALLYSYISNALPTFSAGRLNGVICSEGAIFIHILQYAEMYNICTKAKSKNRHRHFLTKEEMHHSRDLHLFMSDSYPVVRVLMDKSSSKEAADVASIFPLSMMKTITLRPKGAL